MATKKTVKRRKKGAEQGGGMEKIVLNLAPDMVAQVDAYAEHLQKAVPDMKVTREDAARMLLAIALEVLQETGPEGS